FIRSEEPSSIRVIRVVGQYWWVQETVGVKPVTADRKTVFQACIGNSSRAVHGSKTATARIELPVQPERYVLLRHDFHNPAKLATVLCGIICCPDTHRIHTIRVDRRRNGCCAV